MDAFSYLSVLISIVIGLAITQVLQGYRGILIARARVRLYGPVLAWGGLLLLISVQSWWAMFGLRQHGQWTFIQFVLVLLQAVLVYMLAALVFPDVGSEQRVDLRAHYFEHARWFFGFGLSLLVISVLKDLTLDGHWPGPANLAFHGFFFTAWTIAALTQANWYHRILPAVMVTTFAAYILVLFARL